MTRRRTAKLVLLVLAVALVAGGVFAWEPLYWWVMTERAYVESLYGKNADRATRGWRYRSRWTSDSGSYWYSEGFRGTFAWDVQSGFKALESHMVDDKLCVTWWHPDGRLREQFQVRHDGYTGIGGTSSPPWLWGVTDQIEPTMPTWMKDDEQWQAALDALED